MNKLARWEVPTSWAWVSIGEIATVTGGGTPKTSDASNFTYDGIPWLTPADLTGYSERYISRGARDITQKGLMYSSAKLMPVGTVLFSSRAPIGYCAIASNPVSTNQGFKNLTLHGDLSPEYAYCYMKSAKEYAESRASGTTFKEISGSKVKELAFPLPPLAEQSRIVEKLDGLTAANREAAVALTRAETLITRYKAAVLTATTIHNSKGVEFDRYSLGDLVTDISYGTSTKCHYELPKGIGVLRIPNIQDGQIDKTDLKFAELNKKEIAKLSLQSGDILIIRSNGSVNLVGRTAIVQTEDAGLLYAGYLIRIRVARQTVNPSFLNYYLASSRAREEIEEKAKSTSGVNNINSKQIAALSVPLPPIEEQAEIVSRIETAFAQIDILVSAVTEARARIESLDRAILARAFRGALVPQVPNDEPASELLKRVKAQAPVSNTTNGPPKRRPKKMPKASEQLKDALGKWPKAGLTFEDLQSKISAPYDDIRDAIFELLGGENPILQQAFDEKARTMLLLKVVE